MRYNPDGTYKFLGPNRRPCHGGTGQWPRPGEWLQVRGELVPCRNGIHLCEGIDLPGWLGPQMWVAEPSPRCRRIRHDDKLVVSKARLIHRVKTWNDHTARLFACDCAERVLSRAKRPDKRSRNAVDVARRFAGGQATPEELAAAWYAAGTAAATAAATAAWYAAGTAAATAAATAAGDAAWYAARDAAWYAAATAAGDAAWDAAWDAERRWQHERLFFYLNQGA